MSLSGHSSRIQSAMNADLVANEPGCTRSRDEKAALRRAKEAERAFRASKGYAPDTFWARLKKRLHP